MKLVLTKVGNGNPEIIASGLDLDPHFRGDDMLHIYVREMSGFHRQSFEMASNDTITQQPYEAGLMFFQNLEMKYLSILNLEY